MLLLPQEDDIAKTVAAYAGLQQWGTLQVVITCIIYADLFDFEYRYTDFV